MVAVVFVLMLLLLLLLLLLLVVLVVAFGYDVVVVEVEVVAFSSPAGVILRRLWLPLAYATRRVSSTGWPLRGSVVALIIVHARVDHRHFSFLRCLLLSCCCITMLQQYLLCRSVAVTELAHISP